MQFKKLISMLAMSIALFLNHGAASAQTPPWQQTSGPEGGTVNVIAVNKANGYIFAVVAGAGMMRSTDNGGSWVLKNTGLGNAGVQALVINANGDIFAGTNGQGIFRSTDHGESWAQINTGIATNHRNIRALIVKPSTGDIFAGTSSLGLYRSSNNGNSWTPLPTGLTGSVAIQSFAVNQASGMIFAGTDNRHGLRSSDNGNTWTRTDTSTIYNNIRALTVAADGAVVAGADSANSTKRAILRSANNGDSWTLVYQPTSSVTWFVLNSSNQIWAGTGGSGVYASSDNGSNWTPRNDGLRGYGIRVLALNASDHLFAGAHCSGIFRSTNNGASWEAMNNGLRYTEILSLSSNHATGVTIAGSHCGGVYRSTDNGDNWTWAGLPGASVQALITLSNGYFLAGTARIFLNETQGDIYRSTDNGVTWAPVTPDNDAYFSFAVGPNGEIYAGTGFYRFVFPEIRDYGDIYRSINNGSTWTRVASDLDDWVYGLAVAPDGRVYAGTREGVYRSAGGNWHKLNPYNTRSVAVISTNPNVILIGTSGGIWRSPDGGDSWMLVRSMPNNFTWSLVGWPAGEIFAGTETTGVLKSADTGNTWTSFNAGLTNMNVRSLAVPYPSRQIFAGTNGRGAFLHVEEEVEPAPVVSAVNPETAHPGQTLDVAITGANFVNGATVAFSGAGITVNSAAVVSSIHITVNLSVAANAPTGARDVIATNPDGQSGIGAGLFSVVPAAGAAIKPIVANSLQIGAEFTIDIEVVNVQNLFGLSFELNYTNTQYLDALQAEAGAFLGNDLVFLPTIDDANGKVSIGITRKAGQGGISGSGVLARVKFTSLETTPSGTQITFSLNNVSANDPSGTPVSLTPSGATTTIQGLLVWPGDTNNDGIVNQNDVLPLGLHWSRTGSARQNASMFWQGQPATPWTPEAATYADADGNGVVNQNDVLPIGINWGKTHGAAGLMVDNKNNPAASGFSSDGGLCYVIGGSLDPGQEFWLDVQVTGASNLFGLAFELSYSPAVNLEYQTAEAGDFMGADVVFFASHGESAAKVNVGISRKSPAAGVSGSGIVARIRMRMAANAPGGETIAASFQNMAANDPSGAAITITPAGSCPATSVIDSNSPGGAPQAFALHANSPNPFNPSTTIAYDLPQAVEVKLQIFDMLGRQVRTLVSQMQPAGRYAITWDGRNEQGQQMASGTFIYRLQAVSSIGSGQGFSQVRRMALVR